MAGVGQHRQRAGEDAADRLGEQQADVDRQRHPHPPPAVLAPRLQRVGAEAVRVAGCQAVHDPSLGADGRNPLIVGFRPVSRGSGWDRLASALAIALAATSAP